MNLEIIQVINQTTKEIGYLYKVKGTSGWLHEVQVVNHIESKFIIMSWVSRFDSLSKIDTHMDSYWLDLVFYLIKIWLACTARFW